MQLVKWDKIRTEIDQAKDFDELSNLRDKLKAYETLAKQRNMSKEVKNSVGEYLLRADRKLGQWLKDNVKQTQFKGKDNFGVAKYDSENKDKTSLKETHLDKYQSSNLQKIASISEDKFEEIVNDMKEEEQEVSEAIMLKTIKKIDREYKIEEQKKSIESGELKAPKGKYDVIVIDPPWNYQTKYDPDHYMGRSANPYPSMTQEQLMDIDLPSNDNCILWLWTTHNFIWDAKKLLEFWGFEYKCILIWNKEAMGIGKWLRKQCEFCLLATKGKPLWTATDFRDILSEQRTTHSTKPEIFYKMVDKYCIGKKLDYFARKKREGWDVYGDEVK